MCGIDIDLFQKLDFIEFRQELLFRNTDLDRLIFENKFTRLEYEELLQLMDMFNKNMIGNVNKDEFESTVLNVIQSRNEDLPKMLAYEFYKQNKYINVFSNLY
jgi:hypothetical protein